MYVSTFELWGDGHRVGDDALLPVDIDEIGRSVLHIPKFTLDRNSLDLSEWLGATSRTVGGRRPSNLRVFRILRDIISKWKRVEESFVVRP